MYIEVFHTNYYDYLSLVVLNAVIDSSRFGPVAVAKHSDQKQCKGGKGLLFYSNL